jgi:hypothetical protein
MADFAFRGADFNPTLGQSDAPAEDRPDIPSVYKKRPRSDEEDARPPAAVWNPNRVTWFKFKSAPESSQVFKT